MGSNRRIKPGQGFSLFDLKDVISEVTDTLSDALSRQGVTVGKDQLFLRLQSLVQDVGVMDGYNAVSPSAYGNTLSASDKIPYSVAGDMLVIAYEQYKNGDKTDAVKNILAAMGSEDFNAIANGLYLMNKKSDFVVKASEDDSEDTDEDDTTDNTDDTDEDDTDNEDEVEDDTIEDDLEDTDDDEDEDEDEDISDDAINNLIAEDENSKNESAEDKKDEDEDEDNTVEDKKEDKVEEVADKSKEDKPTKPTPMGGTSSTLEASHTSKVLANKLSLDGSTNSRAKAKDFLAKNRNL